MRFSSAGVAATGYASVGVNGATPAALSGASAGSFYGPAWLSSSKIVYQNWSSTPVEQSYDTGTLALATLASAGSTVIAAGNNVWAYYLAGSGVFTSNGLGPFASGFLGDVSPDFGELVLVTSAGYLGLTIYSSAAATLLSLSAVALASPYLSPCRLRGHALCYRQTSGWTIVDVTGAALQYRLRTDDVIGWITPVYIGSTLYLLERSDRLTLRAATQAQGWVIQDVGNVTFNPDAISLASGTLRMGWCTTSGETPSSLVVGNFVLSTNTLTLSIVSGGVLTPQTPSVLVPTTFAVGPLMGSGTANVPIPRSDQAIASKAGTYTRPMLAWMEGVGNSAARAQVTANAAINQPTSNAFGAIGSGSNVPITASLPQDTLTLTPNDRLSVTLDPTTKTVTLGLGGEATTTLTGTQNNLDFSNAATLRCNNASPLTITGLLASTAGQRLIIAAINSTVTLTNDGGTPAASGILTTDAASVTLTAPEQILLERDGTTGRWREMRRGSTGTTDYVVMSSGGPSPIYPLDDGNGNFIYIPYTP